MTLTTDDQKRIIELRNYLIKNFDFFEEQSFLRQISINSFFDINDFFQIVDGVNEFIYLTEDDSQLDTDLSYLMANFFAHLSKNLLVPKSYYGWKFYSNLDDIESAILYSVLEEMMLGFFRKRPVSKGLLNNIIRNHWPEIEIRNFKN